ncbi:MAG: ATP-binding protein [Planctomycetota bacterium]
MYSTLYVTNGRQSGTVIQLHDRVISLGRSSINDVQLLDREISRRHFELVLDNGQFWLRDLGSNNGTFLNSARVDYSQLRSGDMIKAGQTELLFTDTSQSQPSSAAPASVFLVNDRTRSASGGPSPSLSDSSDTASLTQDAPPPIQVKARVQADLDFVYRAFQTIGHTSDVQSLIARVLDQILEWVAVDRACIVLKDEGTSELVVTAARFRQPDAASAMRVSKAILRYVQSQNVGVLTNDAREDERWDDSDPTSEIGIHEAICVPLCGHTGFLGAIYVDTFKNPARMGRSGQNLLTEEHLKIMVAIGNHAALAIENARFSQELVNKERLAAIGETIASLSHHIKNILQGINGGTYLLDQGLQSDSRADALRGWQIVRRYQDDISKLVLDMLSYSRERKPERSIARLDQTVAECVELLKDRAREMKVALEWLPGILPAPFEFDSFGLAHAVNNLLHNAIDACEGSPSAKVTVAVGYKPESSHAFITVQDNGKGIAPTELNKIFELFHSTKGNRGTGLGLAVSRKIIQEHGGEISVDSRLGSGSKFTIALPCAGSNKSGEEPATRLQPNFKSVLPADPSENQPSS